MAKQIQAWQDEGGNIHRSAEAAERADFAFFVSARIPDLTEGQIEMLWKYRFDLVDRTLHPTKGILNDR